MKATVDRDACISCGLCADTSPNAFEMDEENLAIVRTDPIPPDAEASCREASDACPVDAITLGD